MQKKTHDDFTPAQQKAMTDCLARLAKNDITAQQFAARYAATPLLPFSLVSLLQLLGLAALVSGFFAMLALQWEDMSPVLRLTTTVGTGLAGFVAAGLWQMRLKAEASLPFLLLILTSAILMTHGISEGLEPLLPDFAARLFIGFGVALLPLLFLVARRVQAETILVTWLWGNSTVIRLFEWAHVPDTVIMTMIAVGNVAAGRALIARGFVRLSVLADVAALTALTAVIWSQLDALAGWNLLLLVFGICLMGLGATLGRGLLLFWGAVQIFASMMHFASFYFKDTLSWPFAVMGMGVVMMALALIVQRLWPHTKSCP
ncbi:MAG: hypothetical protein V4621_04340 [Pseudomonadota bacterium]